MTPDIVVIDCYHQTHAWCEALAHVLREHGHGVIHVKKDCTRGLARLQSGDAWYGVIFGPSELKNGTVCVIEAYERGSVATAVPVGEPLFRRLNSRL